MITIDDGPGELGLLIKPLWEQDTGTYTCTAVYAGNQNLEQSIEVNSFGKAMAGLREFCSG